MPSIACSRSIDVMRTPRVLQLEGLFDIPPAKTSRQEWSAEIPIEQFPWDVGLIVGPSGCGKSTIARELFGSGVIDSFDWPRDRSLLDAFPEGLGIREITSLLSSVGFSSPPSWLRPFHALSTGEQFRCTLARALTLPIETVVVDEFTSVVDRTVARIGSVAVARTVRRRRALETENTAAPRTGHRAATAASRFVAVSCHYDIIDWLDPDWVYEPAADAFHWRRERRRPQVPVRIERVSSQAWKLFRRHHYLSGALHPCARCFVASVGGAPAAFTAVIHFPHPQSSGWREHRTVCLPDFQGVGIGNALSEMVASIFKATGKPYRSTTSHPGMIWHRARSPRWKMIRPMSRSGSGNRGLYRGIDYSPPVRLTASFEYVGPANPDAARGFGVGSR
ncbi:MAG: ABC transporter ATP-binding protein [Planctomycetaceae bacterium]